MNLVFETISSDEIAITHREIFARLLKTQGKVLGDVKLKIDKCRFICIVYCNDTAIAIGAIKSKTGSVFEPEKANLPNLKKHFDCELGYIYTDSKYTGKGIASKVCDLLIEKFENGNLMATTEISANPGMVSILERRGFRCFGSTWNSEIHSNY